MTNDEFRDPTHDEIRAKRDAAIEMVKWEHRRRMVRSSPTLSWIHHNIVRLFPDTKERA